MKAAIVILLVYNQLMVITTSLYNEIEVKNELKILKSQLLVFSDKIEHPEEDAMNTRLKHLPGGSFLRPPKVNTTIIKNKLYDLQNNVTQLNEDLRNNNHNLADIKDRITSLEKELENLNRFYTDEVRQVKQSLDKFQNFFSDLMLTLQENNANREKLSLQLYYNDFLEAIRHNNYQHAVNHFSKIQNETIAKDLIRTTYRILDNVDCFFDFMDNLKDIKKKLLVYEILQDSTREFNLIGICKMFKNRMKLHYDIKSNKMPDDLQNIAKKLLAEIDQRIEAWSALLTGFENQDVIVKIRYHQRLFGPADYHYTVKNFYIDMESYRRKGGRTAILSCYPIDCR